MSDDLVKRLREVAAENGIGGLPAEAADRIEKLEADLETATMKRLLDSNRIEKLEAALREIREEYGYGFPLETKRMIDAALEGKDE